jgi:hypothetical protein
LTTVSGKRKVTKTITVDKQQYRTRISLIEAALSVFLAEL